MTEESAPTSAPDTTPALDPTWRRTRAAYHHLIYLLTQALPPPRDTTPAALAQRNDAAVAQVAALCPINAAETGLAVEVVAARIHALDCLRLARDPSVSDGYAQRCNAQATSMMRLSRSGARQLAQMQKLRRGREINPTTANEDAWTEYRVGQIMAEALPAAETADPGAAPGLPPPDTAPPATEPLTTEPLTAATPTEEPAALDDGASDEDRLEAYVRAHPDRAVSIRRHRGMPETADFPPPPPDLMQALATGQSRLMRALDLLATISES